VTVVEVGACLAGAATGVVGCRTIAGGRTMTISPEVIFPEIVMGTFGTNRIYTVGRVVKVRDSMRPEIAPEWVRFPPYLNAKFITISCPITCDGNIRYQLYIHGWPSG